MFSEKTTRRTAVVLAGLALLLVVWIFIMGAAPSDHVEVRNWSSSWIGLDTLEMLGLVATAALLVRRSRYLSPLAAACATLFAIDAWFDVMTALSGLDRSTAMIFAGIAEIPLSGLLGTLAVMSARPHDHGR